MQPTPEKPATQFGLFPKENGTDFSPRLRDFRYGGSLSRDVDQYIGDPVLKPVRPLIQFRESNLENEANIAARHNFKYSIAPKVLSARGYIPGESIDRLLNPSLSQIPDPHQALNFTAAVQRFVRAVRNNEPIYSMSDFDNDGITANWQFTAFRKAIGACSWSALPDRFQDGYGLNHKMIDEAYAKYGPGLIVTWDYGTTNSKEIQYAQSLGFDVIVFDHHHVGDIRCAANLLVNPGQSGCGYANNVISASGWALLFCRAANEELPPALKVSEQFLQTLNEPAGDGLVADMVPLVGPSRTIAQLALRQFKDSSWPVLRYLLQGKKNEDYSADDISFTIGPKINAVGRLYNARLLIEALAEQDENEAEQIAGYLTHVNRERQELEFRMVQSSKGMIKTIIERDGALPRFLMLQDENFHKGIVGITAQRLLELFHRPAFVFAKETGSARSVPGLHLAEALKSMQELFVKQGGHAVAAGATLLPGKFNEVYLRLNDYAQKNLGPEHTPLTLMIDGTLRLSDITKDAVRELYQLEPFGVGNPAPIFKFEGVAVKSIGHFGRHKENTSVTLVDPQSPSRKIDGKIWRMPMHEDLYPGAIVDLYARPIISPFENTVELEIKEVRKAI